MDDDTFYTNAALGTDLLTSYAGASGDDDEPPRRNGCLGAVLVVLAMAYVLL